MAFKLDNFAKPQSIFSSVFGCFMSNAKVLKCFCLFLCVANAIYLKVGKDWGI